MPVVDVSHLQKGKVFVVVDLDGEDRLAGVGGQSQLLHLVVEEVHHLLLRGGRTSGRTSSSQLSVGSVRPVLRLHCA